MNTIALAGERTALKAIPERASIMTSPRRGQYRARHPITTAVPFMAWGPIRWQRISCNTWSPTLANTDTTVTTLTASDGVAVNTEEGN